MFCERLVIASAPSLEFNTATKRFTNLESKLNTMMAIFNGKTEELKKLIWATTHRVERVEGRQANILSESEIYENRWMMTEERTKALEDRMEGFGAKNSDAEKDRKQEITDKLSNRLREAEEALDALKVSREREGEQRDVSIQSRAAMRRAASTHLLLHH